MRRWLRSWRLAGRPIVLRLHAGDVLAVAVPEGTDEHEIRRRVEEVYGWRDVLVLPTGAALAVVRDEALS